jgi:hypothetical protein
MEIILVFVIIVAAPFLLLRKMFLEPAERQPTSTKIFILGAVSWIFILGALAWLILPLFLLYLVFVAGNFGAIMGLALFAIVSGFAYQVNETLDSATVLHYLRESAFFRPIRPDYMHLPEELDKQQIREIHRETSQAPFPTAGKSKRLLTEEEARQYKSEMTAAKKRPLRSRRYEEEIASLKLGETTSIADGWKVYTFDHKLHDFYDEMSRLQIDPVTRTLQFNLNIPHATEQLLRDPQYLYQLKQELYQLFSVLHTDPWLSAYSGFIDRIIATCYGIEPDSFGHAQLYAFIKLDIASVELHRREGKFFNAADLHKISTLTFNDGKPLPDELL